MTTFLWILLVALVTIQVTHTLSYTLLKKRILEQKNWDLNICCGKTDGGGINADIVSHKQVPNMVLVDVYQLPFKDKAFKQVVSSHTIEHVDDPDAFFNELNRVSPHVTLIIPPLWDISAALNVFEHKYVFLTFKKVHTTLPPHTRLPLAGWIQKRLGQRIRA
jgi:hypothetical protein